MTTLPVMMSTSTTNKSRTAPYLSERHTLAYGIKQSSHLSGTHNSQHYIDLDPVTPVNEINAEHIPAAEQFNYLVALAPFFLADAVFFFLLLAALPEALTFLGPL